MPKIDDHQDDPFEKLVLDEDFVRAAEHKESSARARMLSARWKKNPPQDTSWRAPVVPLQPKPRRRRRWQLPLFVLLAAALVLVSLNAKKVHDWAFGKTPGAKAAAAAAESPSPDRSTAPALTASPTAAPPTPVAEQTPDMQHPFAGSPADKWPSGASGIALPTAKPVGIFSASTVARDEQLVKNYLVAAYLDPETLAGGYPQAAVDLMDAQMRRQVKPQLDDPKPKDASDLLASRFDPKVAVPLADVRVQGVVSLAGDGANGLDVRADFLFVYASHPVGSTDQVARTIARRTLTFRFFDPNRYQALAPGKVFLAEWQGSTGNSSCGFTHDLIVPAFETLMPTDSASEPAPSGTPIDPYDMSKPVDAQGSTDCSPLSRQ
ncbi:SCO2583/SCO2584 N-terminal domain-containing protein [Streptacidiphilus melanogenes]|uniref:SCO2583/SCO2584 N-terminal domain-containing protein n=1 Tax=Streptacidiphilus melanogenes TaxID=411235 RepID=UPI0005A8ACC4|nr:hypothetical protein [Streptacidiphilus melanogenes]